MRKREEKMRKEAEEISKKYKRLLDEVKKEREGGGQGMNAIVKLKMESEKARHDVEEGLKEEVGRLREEVDRSSKDSEGAIKTSK